MSTRTSVGSVIGQLIVHRDGSAHVTTERGGHQVPVIHPQERTTELRTLLGLRVEVSGVLTRRQDDVPLSVEMRSVEVLRRRPGPVPYAPDMTGGLTEREFLEQMRGEMEETR